MQSTDGLESATQSCCGILANRSFAESRDTHRLFARFEARRRAWVSEDAKNRAGLDAPVQVHVTFRPRRQDDRAVELAPGAVVADLVRETGEPLDATVAVRKGVPVAEDEPLADGDAVTLLSALSGG